MKIKIEPEQKQVVAKKNNFIQTTKYEMGAQQLKLLLYMMSKIKPTDKEFTRNTYKVSDLCAIIDIENVTINRRLVYKALEQIRDSGFYYKIDGVYRYSGWVSAFEPNDAQDEVTIEFDEVLAPYLLNLTEAYTLYDYSVITELQSKYAIRLYELIKSYSNIGQFIISIEDLKQLLKVDGYTDYKDFKKRILVQALCEINETTDIYVTYEPIREGRHITKISFVILFGSKRKELSKKKENKENE